MTEDYSFNRLDQFVSASIDENSIDSDEIKRICNLFKLTLKYANFMINKIIRQYNSITEGSIFENTINNRYDAPERIFLYPKYHVGLLWLKNNS